MTEEIKQILDRLERLENKLALIDSKGLLEDDSHKLLTDKPSLTEFLISKNPSGDVQRALAIGYYLEVFEGLKLFNSNDLRTAFERAKEVKPANINDKVNLNIQKGHMSESSEKKDNLKAWYLTRTGRLFVESGFGK